MGSPNATNTGISEYHVEQVLHRGWTIYMSSAVEFAKLFPGVDPARVSKWHAELAQQRPRIALAWSRGGPSFPEFVVLMESESVLNTPLGQRTYVRESDGREIHQELVRQTLVIEVRTRSPEATIAASRVIRAIMYLATEAFEVSGYSVVSYAGSDALTPEQMMMAEQFGLAGISVRRIRYELTAMVDTPEPTPPAEPIDWFVLHEDLTLAGNPGGVVPYEGT